MEVDRRVKAVSCQYRHSTGEENAMVHLWLNRARQAAEMAQELERAATKTMKTIGAALSDQTWDHGIVYELLDDATRKMELELTETFEPNLVRYDPSTRNEIHWVHVQHQVRVQQQKDRMHQRARRMDQLEGQRERLEAFVIKIRANERADQVKITRQDYKACNGTSGTEGTKMIGHFSLDQQRGDVMV